MASIVVEAVPKSNRNRAPRTSVVPTVLRPTGRQLARLSEQDRRLVLIALSEPLEYVDHPLLHAPGAERRLFGRSRRTVMRPESPAGQNGGSGILAPEAELRLFWQFNYARMRQVRLLRRFSGRRPSLVMLRTLALWARRAAELRGWIVESNLPLVLAMARRAAPMGIDFSDLISEGNFALLRSVDKFDCSRGFKFSTYACRAILKSFSRVMMRNGRYRSRFPVEFEPSLERSDFIERQRQCLEEDCAAQILEILADNRASLNEMEQQVIRERFALDTASADGHSKTLEQVGEMIGVTKERVRQIQNRALRKLRTALEADFWER